MGVSQMCLIKKLKCLAHSYNRYGFLIYIKDKIWGSSSYLMSRNDKYLSNDSMLISQVFFRGSFFLLYSKNKMCLV